VREVLIAAEAQPRAGAVPLTAGFAVRLARKRDAANMAELYREVIASCPFPVLDPAFLSAAWKDSTLYFGVWKEKRIVALSCAEIDISSSSAELTHFAIQPEHCCQGLSLHLLQQMEEKVMTLGIRSLFTVARAYSSGMNITFARNGYHFGGTLTNDINICGRLESMNVWHKSLPDDPKFAWRFLIE
jgi:putative beta-lysine N-acetyltransferase